MPELSLIIPVMNEAPNIAALSERIASAMASIDHEVIWVNDGSTDNTSERIQTSSNKHTRLIVLDKNYGQSAALQAGIWNAHGKYIATLDGDGQNDPQDLPVMLQLIRDHDLDMVAGIRADRKDHISRTIPSRIANLLIRFVTKTHLKDLGCSTRVMTKNIALTFPLKKGIHRYINVLAEKQGARIMQVPVNHDPRIAGKSKYGMGRIFPVIRDLVGISFSSVKKGPYTVRHFEIRATWPEVL